MSKGSGFTSEQWLNGLLPGVDSARSVLASADRLLRQDGALERDLDATLATYSIGVERLMKLALGTAAVSKGEGWPKKMGFTRDGWGNALDEIDERLRSKFREAIESGDWERKQTLHSWICTLDNDPAWAAVVRTLRNYADTSRYHHLDQVSGKEISSRPSKEMWDEAERVAIASSPSLSAHHQRTKEDPDFAPFERELRAEVADSIKRWVSIVCLFGFHGVLGEDWRVIGASVLPNDALLIRALPSWETQERRFTRDTSGDDCVTS